MTQQYIAGEFSSLLSDLQQAPGDWAAAIDQLRWEIERSPVWRLRPLAHEAMSLTDMLCWTALERGDERGFRRSAITAGALREFTENAGLLR